MFGFDYNMEKYAIEKELIAELRSEKHFTLRKLGKLFELYAFSASM
ncbi:MAG: hypothetical protein K5756_06670 [Clostridiales bacterium]|nr:hypothetical protein [Clostridiales bacterium]